MRYKKTLSITVSKGFLTGTALACLSLTSMQMAVKAQVPAQTSNYATRSNYVDPRQAYHGPKSRTLRAPVELPDLPHYTARAYFLCGFDYAPDTTTKQRTVQLKYSVHEAKESVLDWYRDALSSYGWKVTNSQSNAGTITGFKDKNSCIITVAEAKARDHWFSSTITIDYKLGL